jgi:hypothetical protein
MCSRICFLQSMNYLSSSAEIRPSLSGSNLDSKGEILFKFPAIWHFTSSLHIHIRHCVIFIHISVSSELRYFRQVGCKVLFRET